MTRLGYRDKSNPWKLLASEIIVLATKDLRGQNGAKRKDAREFFCSDWFETVAAIACLEVEPAREALGIPQRH